jgi:hypothetical protein
MRGLADELAANPTLGDLRADFLELIAGCCVNVAFAKGERVISVGDPADPELGHELYRCFATMLQARLRATRLQLLDLYGSS